MRTGVVPPEQIDPRIRDVGDFVSSVKKFLPHVGMSAVGIPGTIYEMNYLRKLIAEQNWGMWGDVSKVVLTGGHVILGIVGLDAASDMSEYSHPVRKGLLQTESAIATGVGIVGTIDEIFDTKFLPGWGAGGLVPRDKPCPKSQRDQSQPKTWQPRQPRPQDVQPPTVAQKLTA